MIGTPFTFRYNMVNHKVPKLKHRPAACTQTLLLTEQLVLVSAIVRQNAKVCALRDVGPLDRREVMEQINFLANANLNEINRLFSDVNTHPLTVKPFGSKASRRATAKRIKHHVACFATGANDAV